jgi:hypothetical protein
LRRGARIAGRKLDDDGHRVRARRDDGRFRPLDDVSLDAPAMSPAWSPAILAVFVPLSVWRYRRAAGRSGMCRPPRSAARGSL